ncbi:HET-domain-containing protein, partial [Podospora conica]
MRLLNTATLIVEDFPGPELPGCPPYSIVSHTWDRDEVTLQEVQTPTPAVIDKAGYQKVLTCAAKAKSDGYEHVWIDTCCIDKTSSAELSEAINSMYLWYKMSHVCYAYLADIPTSSQVMLDSDPESPKSSWSDISTESDSDSEQVEGFDASGIFRNSKWFKRGWTLQELIAPRVLEFYAADWTEIGTKTSLSYYLSIITRIRDPVLRGQQEPTTCLVAERMSWASHRKTTRIEDQAYSLLGIFNVNIPLIYGEGGHAFQRLQEEIMKTTEEYSL